MVPFQLSYAGVHWEEEVIVQHKPEILDGTL